MKKFYTNRYSVVNPSEEMKKINDGQIDLFITEATEVPSEDFFSELPRIMKNDSHLYFITQNDVMLDFEITKQMVASGYRRLQTLSAKTSDVVETDFYSVNSYTILLFRKDGTGNVKKTKSHSLRTTFEIQNLKELRKILIEQSSIENEIVFDLNDKDGLTAITAFKMGRRYLSFIETKNEQVTNRLSSLKTEKKTRDYFEKSVNRVQKLDAIAELEKLPTASIDLIVSDPPYKISRKSASFKHDDVNIADYATELYRVLKDNKHAYIMTNNDHLFEFESALHNAGFKLNGRLVWEKNTVITSGYYYASNSEYILFVSKGEPEEFEENHLNLVNYHLHTRNKFHATQKPVDLLKDIILSASNEGDIVLDPFSGSASTAIAAIECKRNFITYEIYDLYYDISRDRIFEAKLRMKKEDTVCEKSLVYIKRKLSEYAKLFENYIALVTEDKAKYRKPKSLMEA